MPQKAREAQESLLTKWLDTLDLSKTDIAMERKVDALNEMIRPVIKLENQGKQILEQAANLIKETQAKNKELEKKNRGLKMQYQTRKHL